MSEHSELFLSLGRYALLFEDKFCEHCNLNSLTAKNLRACDTVERGSSYFDLLEDGRQYTFEEMWLLWRKDEIYVRLYAMLTPLSVDRRLLTLRQLLKYGLSAATWKTRSWNSLPGACWNSRSVSGIGVLLDTSAA